MSRWLSHTSLVAAVGLSACVAPENPCDPAADPSARATSSLSGRVVDQDGAPVAGVTVLIRGRGETTLSQADGGFVLDGLPPNDGTLGYELIASPPSPLVGGRAVAPPLACEDEAPDLELVVVRPPATPEAEVVQATAPDRLFVAFASSGEDPGALALPSSPAEALAACALDDDDGGVRYRVEVRPPFGTWQPTLLSVDPRLDLGAIAGAREAGLVESISEPCSRALCAHFIYANPELKSESARCAEVWGVLDDEVDGGFRPLEPFGSYQVRVVAERALDDKLIERQLPPTVRSPDTAAPAQISLAPTSLLPVPLHPDPATSEEHARALDIECVVPVAQGRFAMIDSAGLRVVGMAEDVDPTAYADARGVSDGAMAVDDDGSSAAAGEVAADDGSAAAILPAGPWVRVWKRMGDPALGPVSSKIEKVFIGARSHDEAHGDAGAEPVFNLDVAAPGMEGLFRGMTWLSHPQGRVAEYDPADGYLLFFREGFVVLEREDPTRTNGDLLASHMGADFSGNLYSGAYAGEPAPTTGEVVALSGFCEQMGSDAVGMTEEPDGTRVVRMCFNLAAALGEDLDLRGAGMLQAAPEVVDPTQTMHVFVDGEGDRVLAVRTDRLAGSGELPLVEYLQRVPVGVRPTTLASSRVLECEGQTVGSPVLLVANQGSQDVSVLEITDPVAMTLDEVAAIPLPAVPLAFLADPDGPTCEDPYGWIVVEDGRMFPLDLRAHKLEIPSCDGAPCGVSTRGRARGGAVARDALGRGRVVVGGRGLLSEVGFLRPGR